MAVAFLTGILMWAYGFLAYNFIDHHTIRYTGFAYAFIHLLAPFMYRYTKSLTAGVYTMLIPGGLFQVHFSWLTGGFFTSTIMWVGILPLIAGILTSKRHTIIWALFATISIITVFVGDILMGPLPNYFNQNGRIIAQFQVVFGMILLNSCFTLFLLELAKRSTEEMGKRALSKQNLLRIIAHDITNPLTVISSAAFSFKRAELPEKLQKKSDTIEKCVKSITASIESIRDIEAYESGKKELNFVPVNLKNCVENAEVNLQSLIDIKKVKLIKDIPSDAWIMGIESIVENQIIANLLSNAVKYSEQGGNVEVVVEINAKDICLKVRDHGIGIPSYILNNLFDPFAKTNREGTGGEHGTGFGMPIVKNSVELLKGKIDVESFTSESNNGQGSIFILNFKKAESINL
ncbi:GHKL domain protein [Bacteriovorax sp. BSW11_IV]|nr:GHKL domain protein [Bacteriovorax sp. BSW11_IV]